MSSRAKKKRANLRTAPVVAFDEVAKFGPEAFAALAMGKGVEHFNGELRVSPHATTLREDFQQAVAKMEADYKAGPPSCSHLVHPGPSGEVTQCISCGWTVRRA